MSSGLAKAALLTASVAVAVLGAECALRFFFHAAPQLDLDIYRKENGLLLLRPSLERRHVTRYWDVAVRTNSEGWRDAEPQPADSTILGLGDSFAFGWGVEQEESFFSLAEHDLSAQGAVRIIKAGVPGSATIDQEKLLERLIPRYRPAAVVIALFVGNDFTETGLGGAERLRVTDGLLELQPLDDSLPGSGETWRTLARKSHLLQLLRATQFQMMPAAAGPSRTWDAWMREFAQIHLRQPSAQAAIAIEKTFQSLDRIAERCRSEEIGLMVLALPRSFQVNEGEREEMQRALGVAAEDLDLDRPQRLLREWSLRQGVLLADPLQQFRAKQADGVRLYYSPDAHLTPAGHQLAAVAARQQFRELAGVD